MHTSDIPLMEIGNNSPEWHEPFPEPQTIPTGWDLSEILSSSASAVDEDADPGIEN